MINFRYHVVSLTAVFLALAIGLIVGTAALNGPVADSLESRIEALNKDNNVKRDQINQYRDELNSSQDYAAETAPIILGGKLTGRKLALIALPGAQKETVDGVEKMLTVAGASISAQLAVQDKFFEPNNANELLNLADSSTWPNIPAAALPRNSDGVETAAALLALTLLQRTPPPAPGDVTAVLTAFTKAGYVTVAQDAAAGGAEGIVLVAGPPATDADAATKNEAVVTMADQLGGKDRPLVVAGDSVGDGNLVSAIRNDPSLVKEISTVDNASTVQGQAVTGMATVERLAQDRVGHYGLGSGATSIVPTTAP